MKRIRKANRGVPRKAITIQDSSTDTWQSVKVNRETTVRELLHIAQLHFLSLQEVDIGELERVRVDVTFGANGLDYRKIDHYALVVDFLAVHHDRTVFSFRILSSKCSSKFRQSI